MGDLLTANEELVSAEAEVKGLTDTFFALPEASPRFKAYECMLVAAVERLRHARDVLTALQLFSMPRASRAAAGRGKRRNPGDDLSETSSCGYVSSDHSSFDDDDNDDDDDDYDDYDDDDDDDDDDYGGACADCGLPGNLHPEEYHHEACHACWGRY